MGPPGGTSTSTAPGASAAASGAPGTSRTATAPGVVANAIDYALNPYQDVDLTHRLVLEVLKACAVNWCFVSAGALQERVVPPVAQLGTAAMVRYQRL
jgi:hypothetical protein